MAVNETTNAETAGQNNASMDEYRNSPYYQTLGIDELQAQLAGYQTDDATLRQRAESLYRPTYDAELESLRQQLAQQRQAYENQLTGIGASYDRQRRLTNQSYNESAANLGNALTRRGLGRSSLVATQGAYLENQRNQALTDIGNDETAAINSINERVAMLADQAAQSEARLNVNYASQIENRVNELRQQNQSAATNLQLQIATLQQQGYQAYQEWLLANREMELAERQFEHETKRGSGGSSYSGSNAGDAAGNGEERSSDSWLEDLLNGSQNKPTNVAGGALVNMMNNLKPSSLLRPGSLSSTIGRTVAGQTVKNAKANTRFSVNKK